MPGTELTIWCATPRRHEAGADQSHADRPAFRCALLQCGVDEDHASTLFATESGQCASLSDMIVTAIGHSMPNAGSS